LTDLLEGRDIRRGVLELLRDAEEPVLAGDLSKQAAEREDFGARLTGSVLIWLEGFLACSYAWSRRALFACQVLPMVVVDCGRSPGKHLRINLGCPLRLKRVARFLIQVLESADL